MWPLLMSKHVRLEVLPEDACNGHRQLSARKATHESHDFLAEVHGPGTSTASCMGTRRRDHKKNEECSFSLGFPGLRLLTQQTQVLNSILNVSSTSD